MPNEIPAWTFEGDAIRLVGPSFDWVEGRFVLDSSRGTITLVRLNDKNNLLGGGTYAGIYMFSPDGDSLLICIAMSGMEPPHSFGSAPNSGNELFVLER